MKPYNQTESKKEQVRTMFDGIARRYDLLNHLLSLGIDRGWRRRVVRMVRLHRPAEILDMATGTGDLALAILRAMPEIRLTGSDFCQPMLDVAAERGLTNLVCADAMNLPFPSASYDAVTVAFGLRNMASYPDALKEMGRMLRPGGHLLILDFSLPENLLKRPYRFYLHRILPLIAGWMTGHREAYDYLADSIEAFPSGEDMKNLLRNCGYTNITAEPLNGGIASIYTAQK